MKTNAPGLHEHCTRAKGAHLARSASRPVAVASAHHDEHVLLEGLEERLPRARHKRCGVRACAKPLWGVNAGGAGMGVCEWRIMGVCMGRAAAALSAKARVIPRVLP